MLPTRAFSLSSVLSIGFLQLLDPPSWLCLLIRRLAAIGGNWRRLATNWRRLATNWRRIGRRIGGDWRQLAANWRQLAANRVRTLHPLPRREGIRACRLIPRGTYVACFTQSFSPCSGPKKAGTSHGTLCIMVPGGDGIRQPCLQIVQFSAASRCNFPRQPKGTGRAICLHKFPVLLEGCRVRTYL